MAQNAYGFATADPEVNKRAKKLGDRWRLAAIILVVLSYLLFAAGSCSAYGGFTGKHLVSF